MNAFQTTKPCKSIGGKLLALIFCCFFAGLSWSQVYKYVDENGNVVYSDTPPEEQKDLPPADLPDLIIQPHITVTRPAPQVVTADATEIDVSITQPANETTIPPGQMSFTVAAEASRPLGRGEVAILLVNDQELGRSSNTLSWLVDNLIRGEMNLKIQIKNRENRLLAESEVFKVFVQRASINR